MSRIDEAVLLTVRELLAPSFVRRAFKNRQRRWLRSHGGTSPYQYRSTLKTCIENTASEGPLLSVLSVLPSDAVEAMISAMTIQVFAPGRLVAYQDEGVDGVGVLFVLSGTMIAVRRATGARHCSCGIDIMDNTLVGTYTAPSVWGQHALLSSEPLSYALQNPTESMDYLVVGVVPMTFFHTLLSLPEVTSRPSRAPTPSHSVGVLDLPSPHSAHHHHSSHHLQNLLLPPLLLRRQNIAEAYFPMSETLMRNSWLCATMTEKSLTMLQARLTAKSVVAGTVLSAAGEKTKANDADRVMFFLRRGTVEVTSRGGAVLATLQPGSTFGETGLIFNEQRRATFTAKTLCDLFLLSKKDLEALLMFNDEAKVAVQKTVRQVRSQWMLEQSNVRESIRKRLDKVAIIQDLTPSSLDELAHKAEPRVFAPGQLLCSVSGPCDGLLIIVKGKVARCPARILCLPDLTYVGHTCVVPHRWPYTVTAVSLVDTWLIRRSDICRHVNSHALSRMKDTLLKLETELKNPLLHRDVIEKLQHEQHQPSPPKQPSRPARPHQDSSPQASAPSGGSCAASTVALSRPAGCGTITHRNVTADFSCCEDLDVVLTMMPCHRLPRFYGETVLESNPNPALLTASLLGFSQRSSGGSGGCFDSQIGASPKSNTSGASTPTAKSAMSPMSVTMATAAMATKFPRLRQQLAQEAREGKILVSREKEEDAMITFAAPPRQSILRSDVDGSQTLNKLSRRRPTQLSQQQTQQQQHRSRVKLLTDDALPASTTVGGDGTMLGGTVTMSEKSMFRSARRRSLPTFSSGGDAWLAWCVAMSDICQKQAEKRAAAVSTAAAAAASGDGFLVDDDSSSVYTMREASVFSIAPDTTTAIPTSCVVHDDDTTDDAARIAAIASSANLTIAATSSLSHQLCVNAQRPFDALNLASWEHLPPPITSRGLQLRMHTKDGDWSRPLTRGRAGVLLTELGAEDENRRTQAMTAAELRSAMEDYMLRSLDDSLALERGVSDLGDDAAGADDDDDTLPRPLDVVLHYALEGHRYPGLRALRDTMHPTFQPPQSEHKYVEGMLSAMHIDDVRAVPSLVALSAATCPWIHNDVGTIYMTERVPQELPDLTLYVPAVGDIPLPIGTNRQQTSKPGQAQHQMNKLPHRRRRRRSSMMNMLFSGGTALTGNQQQTTSPLDAMFTPLSDRGLRAFGSQRPSTASSVNSSYLTDTTSELPSMLDENASLVAPQTFTMPTPEEATAMMVSIIKGGGAGAGADDRPQRGSGAPNALSNMIDEAGGADDADLERDYLEEAIQHEAELSRGQCHVPTRPRLFTTLAADLGYRKATSSSSSKRKKGLPPRSVAGGYRKGDVSSNASSPSKGSAGPSPTRGATKRATFAPTAPGGSKNRPTQSKILSHQKNLNHPRPDALSMIAIATNDGRNNTPSESDTASPRASILPAMQRRRTTTMGLLEEMIEAQLAEQELEDEDGYDEDNGGGGDVFESTFGEMSYRPRRRGSRGPFLSPEQLELRAAEEAELRRTTVAEHLRKRGEAEQKHRERAQQKIRQLRSMTKSTLAAPVTRNSKTKRGTSLTFDRSGTAFARVVLSKSERKHDVIRRAVVGGGVSGYKTFEPQFSAPPEIFPPTPCELIPVGRDGEDNDVADPFESMCESVEVAEFRRRFEKEEEGAGGVRRRSRITSVTIIEADTEPTPPSVLHVSAQPRLSDMSSSRSPSTSQNSETLRPRPPAPPPRKSIVFDDLSPLLPLDSNNRHRRRRSTRIPFDGLGHFPVPAEYSLEERRRQGGGGRLSVATDVSSAGGSRRGSRQLHSVGSILSNSTHRGSVYVPGLGVMDGDDSIAILDNRF